MQRRGARRLLTPLAAIGSPFTCVFRCEIAKRRCRRISWSTNSASADSRISSRPPTLSRWTDSDHEVGGWAFSDIADPVFFFAGGKSRPARTQLVFLGANRQLDRALSHEPEFAVVVNMRGVRRGSGL